MLRTHLDHTLRQNIVTHEVSVAAAHNNSASPKPTKVCVVLVRPTARGHEFLMFRHPTGGVQLVKGTIESGEHPHQAALRELHEESGIHDAMIVRGLGACEPTLRGKPWEFVQVNVARTLPDEWAHFTGDGGGLLFRFFWHHLDEFPTRDWHIKYVRAFVFIRDSLAP